MNKAFVNTLNSVPLEARKIIELRMREFERVRNSSGRRWFSELCFCILTANSKAETAIKIQKKLGAEGFLKKSKKEISEAIRNEGHRFHNNKAEFILEARVHRDIKRKVQRIINNYEDEEAGTRAAREWLVKNIKGIGMKEASHFLRNVGFPHVAILDRHILRFMKQYSLIDEIPKSISKKRYLEIEKILDRMCEKAGKKQGELDFYMWFVMTGRILK